MSNDNDGAADKPLPSIADMLAGGRPAKRIRWPGRDFDVCLVVLLAHDLNRSRLDAQEWVFKAMKGDAIRLATPLANELQGEEEEVQILWRALRTTRDTDEKAFKTADHLRNVLEAETRELLFAEYIQHQAERSPISRMTSDTELEELVSRLGKVGTRETSLSGLDSATLRSIIIKLADRLRNSMREASLRTLSASASSGDSTTSGNQSGSSEPSSD